jgi:hypothetical protein
MKKKKFFKKSVIATLFFVSVLVSVYIYKPTSLSTSITATTSGGAIITIEEDTLDMLNPTLTITFPFSLYYLQFDVDSIDRFITSLSGNTHTLTGSTLQGTTGGCTTGTSGFTILCESTATQNGNFDTIVLVLDRNNLENGVNNFVLNEILQSSSDGQQFEESGNVLFNISYIAPTASQALEGSETPGIPITTATNLAAGETLTLNTSSSIPAHNNGPCEGTFINGDISHCVQVFDDSGTLLYIVNMVGSTVVFNFTAAANPGAVLFRSSASAIALAPGTYTFVTQSRNNRCSTLQQPPGSACNIS